MKKLLLCLLVLTLTGCMSIPRYRAWVEDRHDRIYGKGPATVKIVNQTEKEYDVEIDGGGVREDFEAEYHLKPKEHIILTLDSGSYFVCFDRSWWQTASCVNKRLYSNSNVEWNVVEDNTGGDPVRMGLDIMSIFFR
jgi:hypothetical protein